MTPQIIAHRGASYLAPENTLTAFKKAMEIGADGVEMDVQQTIDAGLVIHHDYMIDLHTDISGKIYDMTMGDLKELDFIQCGWESGFCGVKLHRKQHLQF